MVAGLGRWKPSFSLSVFAVFLALVVVLGGMIAWYNYRSSSDIALGSAHKLFVKVSDHAADRLYRQIETSAAAVDYGYLVPDLGTPPVGSGMGHPALAFMIGELRKNPDLYSLYAGYQQQGSFFQVIQVPTGESRQSLLDSLNAPVGTAYIVRTIRSDADGGRTTLWTFLDEEALPFADRTSFTSRYDPRARPWYKAAREKPDERISTAPYLFTSSMAPGITIARELAAGAGVIGLDIELGSLGAFLGRQEISETSRVFLMDGEGRLIAHPDPDMLLAGGNEAGGDVTLAKVSEAADPLVRGLGQRKSPEDGTAISFTEEGRTYLAMTRAVEMGGRNYRLAIVALEDDFTRESIRASRNTVLVTLALVLLALPVIAFVSRRISHALRLLGEEVEAIERFELEGPVVATSRILEVDTLIRAVEKMKFALRIFGLYVPKDLVADIVRSGTEPRTGGKRQRLTVMFTDIEGFTDISETMPPEDLMIHVSGYFETLGDVISRHGGVVDKFIGDAIMAMWNAPSPDANHVHNACLGILCTAWASKELNDDLAANRFPVFKTRFGLHSGDAVVGNVGSSDRWNYTAFGATVNVASRLEGLNKKYGTRILVSEVVRDEVDDNFVFRQMDLVQPKGCSTPVAVYELMGVRERLSEDEPEGIIMSDRDLELAETWKLAYSCYARRDWEGARTAFTGIVTGWPDDQPAKVYLERSRYHLDNPPPADWNGVEVMKTK